MSQPGVMIYLETLPAFESLSDSDAGALLKAILNYAQSGSVPEFEGSLGVAWSLIRPRIDRDAERYERVRAIRAEAGRKGGLAKVSNAKQNLAKVSNAKQIKPTTTTTTSTTTTTNNIITHKFIPPTLAEIKSFCSEKHISIDAEKFYAFYEANGWMVGRNKMKSWQSAIRYWERNGVNGQNKDTANKQSRPIPNITRL